MKVCYVFCKETVTLQDSVCKKIKIRQRLIYNSNLTHVSVFTLWKKLMESFLYKKCKKIGILNVVIN